MNGPRIGSLFSGYGGLDMGVQSVIGGEVAWHVEFDDAPSRILAHHYPGVPNYGDITAVDWAEVEPVDVLTGGFPCQDVSLAGLRRGLKDGTRSGLWSEFAVAIDMLRPQLVVIENVRGLLSAAADRKMESDPWGLGDGKRGPVLRALGAVLGDLADIGYDARWVGIRAADVGAPHARVRVFVLAYPGGEALGLGTGLRAGEPAGSGRGRSDNDRVPAPAADAPRLGRREDEHGLLAGEPDASRCAPALADARSARLGEQSRGASAEEAGPHGRDIAAGDRGSRPAQDWGPYRPAIDRWERRMGRRAPNPTRPDGKNGANRLNPAFVEWMMGLPEGWVTDPAIGLSRAQQLKALGNGVVPQQAALAVATLLNAEAVAA